MWNPGFDFEDSQPARLFGYSRKLCLWSVKYRGTPENPGLVVGLVRGGSCVGIAYRINDHHQGEVFDYLYERELANHVYQPVAKYLYLKDHTMVTALTFVSRSDHKQYATAMPEYQIVSIVRKACGPMGSNEEYILNMVKHLDLFGVCNSQLHRVAEYLQK